MGTFNSTTIFLMLAVAAVTGCVTLSPETVQSASVKDLCTSIVGARHGNSTPESAALAVETLRSRKTFTPQELAAIERGNVFVGMSEEAGLCATGYFWYGLNTTVTAAGTTRQYVLGDGRYNPRSYLYAAGGRVVAYQN